jgi:hypothetical protein
MILKLAVSAPTYWRVLDGSKFLADVIAGFQFDIVNSSNNRPALTYVSATGDVYLTNKSSADVLQTADANLKAVNPGDDTWEFKAMNPAANPSLGFGIGTVGNNNLSPNNFSGSIVDGMDYSIYAGDVTDHSEPEQPPACQRRGDLRVFRGHGIH